jgi:hypothetical protein
MEVLSYQLHMRYIMIKHAIQHLINFATIVYPLFYPADDIFLYNGERLMMVMIGERRTVRTYNKEYIVPTKLPMCR